MLQPDVRKGPRQFDEHENVTSAAFWTSSRFLDSWERRRISQWLHRLGMKLCQTIWGNELAPAISLPGLDWTLINYQLKVTDNGRNMLLFWACDGFVIVTVTLGNDVRGRVMPEASGAAVPARCKMHPANRQLFLVDFKTDCEIYWATYLCVEGWWLSPFPS